MGDALLLFNISRPQRLTELSNVTQMASRTLAGNSRSFSPRAAMLPPARLTPQPRAAMRFLLPGPRLVTVLTSPQPTTSLTFMCRTTGPEPILEQMGYLLDSGDPKMLYSSRWRIIRRI